MIKGISLALVLSSASLMPFGSASAQHMNEPGNPCEAFGVSTEISNCWEAELKRADAELNSTYSAIMSVLRLYPEKKDASERLRTAQRSWIAYRDDACAAEAGLYTGGSANGLVASACLAVLTGNRTKALRQGFWWQVEKFGQP